MNPELLERLLSELGARVLPASEAQQASTAYVGPDGRDLTPSEALALRALAHDAALRAYLEIARQPKATLGIPDLQPIPLWVQISSLAIVLFLICGQGFLGLLILLVWLRL